MKIKVLQKFKDGVETFEQDDIRAISDERGDYFVSLGWALNESGQLIDSLAETLEQPFIGEINLDINNGGLGLGDTNG